MSDSGNQLTLLGTGDAAGFPLYGCDCQYCVAARESRQLAGYPAFATQRRRPCSALLQVGDRRYLIDAGLMDIAERFPAGSLDGILLTHFHADHVQGLFHLRWGRGSSIPVYCPPDPEGCADLFKHPGILNFTPIELGCPVPLAIPDGEITPIKLEHSKLTYGYVMIVDGVSIAYLTDTKGLSDDSEQCLRESLSRQGLVAVDHLIIDTSAPDSSKASRNHNTLSEAIDIHHRLAAQQTTLTHIGHDLHTELATGKPLPERVQVGYDGLVVRL